MASGPAEVMSIEELAEYLKISVSTLYKLAQEGGLPGQKVGRRWRFQKGAIDDWLRRHPHDFVIPSMSRYAGTDFVPPQSHRQAHIAPCRAARS